MAQRHAVSRARLGAAMAVGVAVATCVLVPSHPGGWPAGVGEGPVPVTARRVDLNVAGSEEIALLPGIGPAIAGRIVTDRAERGPFASVDELRRVKGIGAATLERVRPFATAGHAT